MSVHEANIRRRELLGVYRDRSTAENVVREVAELAGSDGRAGDAHDYVDSLRSEMRQELRDTVFAPQAGLILTREASKGLSVILPICVAGGIVICLPLALAFGGAYSVAVRLLIAVVVGAAAGGTIGFIIGAAVGMRGPDDRAAAQRGVTVRAWPDRDDVREVMVAAKPLRLDVVDETGEPLETVTTEHGDGRGAVQELGEHVEPLPTGDWSPVQADDPRHGRSVPGQDAPMDVPRS